MPIPEAQLDVWAKQGSTVQSQQTYASVRNALDASDAPYSSRRYDRFLQGSYGNDTNIWSDSDVDVVIRLDGTFYKDLSALPAEQVSAYNRFFSGATYSYNDFKADVIAQLVKNFGTGVAPGKKAIFIPGNGSRRDADVLAAAQYRKYWSFQSDRDQKYTEGVVFWTSEGTEIINYPKQHSANCTSKNMATSGWFKPSVRILKNLRNAMISRGVIAEGIAPSYFLEGMLWNVPNGVFGRNYIDTIAGALNWIRECDRTQLLCANEMYYLLNPTSPVTWRAERLEVYLRSTIGFWNSH